MATQAMRSKLSGAAQTLKSNPSFNAGVSIGNSKFDEIEQRSATANIMGAVRLIGGALIGISVLVVVLSEVFSLDQIQNASGSFGGIIDSLESTGVAALSLLVIGLLVVAANRVMGFFGGRGGM